MVALIFESNTLLMLTELYIEALLVDEELADLLWVAWDAGLIPDEVAAIAWFQMSENVASFDVKAIEPT